jgi:hypothetical protein
MSVSTINGKEIKKAVENLRRKSEQMEKAAKIVLRGSAEEIVKTAKAFAPVKSGNLRDNGIYLVEENEGASYKIVADARNKDNVNYAKIVEFSPKINRPFLYPAIEAQIVPMNRQLKQALEQVEK